MRWNCPHCGIDLAVADEKLGRGWSFSRCYQCGGFAVVRQQDRKIVRVDQDENGKGYVIEDQNTSIKPKVIKKETKSVPPKKISMAVPKAPEPKRRLVPQPLPDPPQTIWKKALFPIAVGLFSIGTIGSGLYLFIEGRSIWKKAKSTMTGMTVDQSLQSKKEVVAQIQEPEKIAEEDTLSQRAMAPIQFDVRTEIETNQAALKKEAPKIIPPLVVEVKHSIANVRSGPGLEFPVLGIANQKEKFVVVGWDRRWFRLVSLLEYEKELQSVPDTVWIRNDLLSATAKE